MIINIETVDPSTGYALCVYPRESRRKRSSWIMWISPDGSADLYTQRDESGAIQGELIHLGPNASRVVIPDEAKDDPLPMRAWTTEEIKKAKATHVFDCQCPGCRSIGCLELAATSALTHVGRRLSGKLGSLTCLRS